MHSMQTLSIELANKFEREVYFGKQYCLETHALLISRYISTKSLRNEHYKAKLYLYNEIKIENIKYIF